METGDWGKRKIIVFDGTRFKKIGEQHSACWSKATRKIVP